MSEYGLVTCEKIRSDQHVINENGTEKRVKSSS